MIFIVSAVPGPAALRPPGAALPKVMPAVNKIAARAGPAPRLMTFTSNKCNDSFIINGTA